MRRVPSWRSLTRAPRRGGEYTLPGSAVVAPGASYEVALPAIGVHGTRIALHTAPAPVPAGGLSNNMLLIIIGVAVGVVVLGLGGFLSSRRGGAAPPKAA